LNPPVIVGVLGVPDALKAVQSVMLASPIAS